MRTSDRYPSRALSLQGTRRTIDHVGETLLKNPDGIAWVSSSYGFGDDLAYFEQVFEECCARFPETIILVPDGFPVERYPQLPLRPTLSFHVRTRRRKLPDGTEYLTRLRLPTLRTVLRLFRVRASVFIFIEFTPTAIAAALVAWLTRRHSVLLVESDPAYRGAPSGRLTLAVKRLITRHVDVVLVSNELGYAYLHDEVGAPADRTLIGPYLTSAPELPMDQGNVPAAGAPLRLLFLNSITRRKGLRELLHALAALPSPQARGWCLDVVGSGDDEGQAKRLVSALGLEDQVTFHGRAPYRSIGAYYAAADVVVCPTLGDYRSLSGFEAVNSGKPVVMSVKDGAHREIEAAYRPTWVVDPTDEQQFTAVLSDIISHPDDVRGMARAARATPLTDFGLTRVADNLARAVRVSRSRAG